MAAELCPQCGTPRPPGQRFCGSCAFDFSTAEESVATSESPSEQPPPPSSTPAEPPPPTGRNWGRIALIAVGALIVLAILAYFGGQGGTAADPSESQESQGAASTPEPTPTATPRPTPAPAARVDLVLADSGFTAFSSDGYSSYAVIIENPNLEWVAQRVEVSVTFYDAAGTILSVENDFLTAILPGGRGAIGSTAFDAGTATRMEVVIQPVDESSWFRVEPNSTGDYAFENVTTTRDEFGGHTTTGLIRSTFQEAQESVEVTAVWRNSAGTIVGGDFTFVDTVPAMGEATFELSTFATFSDLAQTEMYADLGF